MRWNKCKNSVAAVSVFLFTTSVFAGARCEDKFKYDISRELRELQSARLKAERFQPPIVIGPEIQATREIALTYQTLQMLENSFGVALPISQSPSKNLILVKSQTSKRIFLVDLKTQRAVRDLGALELIQAVVTDAGQLIVQTKDGVLVFKHVESEGRVVLKAPAGADILTEDRLLVKDSTLVVISPSGEMVVVDMNEKEPTRKLRGILNMDSVKFEENGRFIRYDTENGQIRFKVKTGIWYFVEDEG